MVEGDPEMRRPFVVIEANPRKIPAARSREASLLADYLTGEKGQACVASFAPPEAGLQPVFFPLALPEI